MFDKKVETFLKLGSGAVEAPAGNSSCDSAEEVHDRSWFCGCDCTCDHPQFERR